MGEFGDALMERLRNIITQGTKEELTDFWEIVVAYKNNFDKGYDVEVFEETQLTKSLTPKEDALYLLLCKNRRRMTQAIELMAAIWPGEERHNNNLSKLVKSLQDKISPYGVYIKHNNREGYQIEFPV